MFPSRDDRREAFEFLLGRQSRIKGLIPREYLINPDQLDSQDQPCLIVMKDGCASDLTVGRFAGPEAYLCDELGVESIELAIYNYDDRSDPFSMKGDSGSLVFDGQGRMLGIIHSGMPKGDSNYVTFATPAGFVIEQIKKRYPHADFDRTTF